MLIPTPRNLIPNIPSSVVDWHAKGKGVSQFFNNLSVYFPDGEKFFIKSIRNFRTELKNEELLKAVKAFIQQEANHGVWHKEYNLQIERTGAPQEQLQTLVKRGLGFVEGVLPQTHQLAVTCTLEHLTAIMGELVLYNQDLYLGDSEESMKKLWNMHALEEFEHKCVAFDVFEEVSGSYCLRSFYLIAQTLVFVIASQQSLLVFLLRTKCSLIEFINCYRFQIGLNGFVWKSIPLWFEWFSRDFHPSNRIPS